MKPFLLASCWWLVGVVGCDGDDHGTTHPPDAPVGTHVSGCDDPAVWTAPALASAEAVVYLGGDGCDPAQLPLYRVALSWNPEHAVELEEGSYVETVCWRVTGASPGSGWTAGQELSTAATGWMNIAGFARSVSIEGRAILANGTLAYSIAPAQFALEAAKVVEPAASSAVAVMAADAWAERNAVHLWGQTIPTDEVLGAASLRMFNGETEGPRITLHRVGTNIVRRTWTNDNNQIEYTDIVIGAGTRGQITKWGNAVLVDGTQLVTLAYDNASHSTVVKRRVTLDAEPLEIVEHSGLVWMHMPGSIVITWLSDDVTRSVAVGDGVLVPTLDYFPALYFFDGTTFRLITSDAHLEDRSAMPAADDLARVGKPIGYIDGFVFGERGFLAINDPAFGQTPAPGPASATYAEVFGDGHLGPLSLETAAYVVEHDDGHAELYQAPYQGHCDPI